MSAEADYFEELLATRRELASAEEKLRVAREALEKTKGELEDSYRADEQTQEIIGKYMADTEQLGYGVMKYAAHWHGFGDAEKCSPDKCYCGLAPIIELARKYYNWDAQTSVGRDPQSTSTGATNA